MSDELPREVAMNDAQDPAVQETTTDAAPAEQTQEEHTEEVDEPEGFLELLDACRNINVDRIRDALVLFPNLDLEHREPDDGRTPLLEVVWGVVFHQVTDVGPACVRFLVSRGADVKAQDKRGWTGLHICARMKGDVSLDMAKVLIELGADPSADQRPRPKTEDGAGEDARQEHGGDGCECGQHIGAALGAAFKAATGKTLDLTEQTKELDVTPLHHACGYGDNLPMAELLISHGAKVDVNDWVAGTPLIVAAQAQRDEIVSLLLRQPGCAATLSVRNKAARLPIHHAAESGSKALVAMLVEAGSLVDPVLEGEGVPDREKGLTPLLLACKNASDEGKLDVIEYLLEHGADVAHVGANGQTALFLSVTAKSVDAARLLVKHGADLKASVGPFEDVNSLHVAATSGAAELCRWLVEEAGFGVDAADNSGYTPLIQAAGYSGSPETIRTLVGALGADIEAAIDDGRRALHFAAFKGQEGCARELIALGADKEAVDGSGWTPLHFAARYHHVDVIRLLLEAGAVIGKTVEGGPQPKRKDGEEFDIVGFTAADLARITRGGQESVDVLVAAGEVLSEETKDVVDEDLFEEEKGQCCVM